MEEIQYTTDQQKKIESLDLHYSMEILRFRRLGWPVKPLTIELLEKVGLERVSRLLEEQRK